MLHSDMTSTWSSGRWNLFGNKVRRRLYVRKKMKYCIMLLVVLAVSIPFEHREAIQQVTLRKKYIRLPLLPCPLYRLASVFWRSCPLSELVPSHGGSSIVMASSRVSRGSCFHGFDLWNVQEMNRLISLVGPIYLGP